MNAQVNRFIDALTIDDYQAIAGPDWPQFEELKSKVGVPQFIVDEICALAQSFDARHEKTKSFCVLPFYGWEYPADIACCLMKDHTTLDRVRSDMLQGTRAPECQQCWDLEDAGILSDRMIKNSVIDFYRKTDITALYEECASGLNSEQAYKIGTNNICNAACVTCSGAYSSLWINYEKKNNVNKNKVWQIGVDSVPVKIDYAKAVYIIFHGGESTLSKTNFEILEKLVENNNTDCFISFTTNGSFDLSEHQWAILKKFKNVNFCFSIDGINDVFEYLRFPLTWDKILTNIEKCREHLIDISCSYTLSNVNIYYHAETVAWFDRNNIKYLTNPVNEPRLFRPAALSRDIKDQILSKFPPDTVLNTFLSDHCQIDDVDFAAMKVKIAKQDSWKGIAINDYLPEFAALLK